MHASITGSYLCIRWHAFDSSPTYLPCSFNLFDNTAHGSKAFPYWSTIVISMALYPLYISVYNTTFHVQPNTMHVCTAYLLFQIL